MCDEECNLNLGIIIYKDKTCPSYAISENEAYFSSKCFEESIEELNDICEEEILVKGHRAVAKCESVSEYLSTSKDEKVYKIKTQEEAFVKTEDVTPKNIMFNLVLDDSSKTIKQEVKTCDYIFDTVHELRSVNEDSEVIKVSCEDKNLVSGKGIKNNNLINVECFENSNCSIITNTKREISLVNAFNSKIYKKSYTYLSEVKVSDPFLYNEFSPIYNNNIIILKKTVKCLKRDGRRFDGSIPSIIFNVVEDEKGQLSVVRSKDRIVERLFLKFCTKTNSIPLYQYIFEDYEYTCKFDKEERNGRNVKNSEIMIPLCNQIEDEIVHPLFD